MKFDSNRRVLKLDIIVPKVHLSQQFIFGKMFQPTFTSERDGDEVFQGFKNWSKAERAEAQVRVLLKVAASHVCANTEF